MKDFSVTLPLDAKIGEIEVIKLATLQKQKGLQRANALCRGLKGAEPL
jgi:hypothetical protein